MALLNGTNARDRLRGTTQLDIINGLNGNDDLFGLAGNDILNGGAGNDLLGGGTGTDTMKGGLGNDTYVVDKSGDKTIELAGQGTDLVRSSVTRALGANLENLTLLGGAAINGTGNTLANLITGNGAANVLIGGAGVDTLIGLAGNDIMNGGAGNDVMNGGLGDDAYIVDSLLDVINEAGGDGIDTVQVTINGLTLGANIENGIILAAADNVGIIGNALANVLTGGAGSNTIGGNGGNDTIFGGAGNDFLDGADGDDVLHGGDGDDFFFDGVANPTGSDDDIVFGDAGNDEIVIAFGTDQAFGGTGDDIIRIGVGGNAGNKTFFGNEGSDTLSGGGGADDLNGGPGSDSLEGGGGNDDFIFDAPGTGSDVILDYVIANDTVKIDQAAYGFGFKLDGFNVIVATSAVAVANTPTLLFDIDAATQRLLFDPDGIGSAAAEVVAVFIGLTPSTFTSAEIVFV